MYADTSRSMARLGDNTSSPPPATVNPTVLAQLAALFAFYFGPASITASLAGLQNLAQNTWAMFPPTLVGTPLDGWRQLELGWFINFLQAGEPSGGPYQPIPTAIGLRIIDLLGATYSINVPADWRTLQATAWAAGDFNTYPSGTEKNPTAWYLNAPYQQYLWAQGHAIRNPLLPLALPPVTAAVTSTLTAAGAPGMSSVATGGGSLLKAALWIGGGYLGLKALKVL